MSDKTGIEWTDSTFNPWIGCTKVGPGCDHCYAEQRMDNRFKIVNWGAEQPRKRTSAANWKLPIKWNEQPFVECETCGWRGELRQFSLGNHPAGSRMCPSCAGSDYFEVRRRVFCSSLADVFDNEVDPQWRADLFALIAATPNLDWLILTKRIGNAPSMIMDALQGMLIRSNEEPPTWPWHNVWLGATIVNQEEADRDIPKLLKTPAAARFLSMEPLLGPVNLIGWLDVEASCPCGEISCDHEAIDWVIVGGESGHKARPMHPEWVRSLRDQCHDAGVPFLFKQWGEWQPDFYPVAHMRMTEKSMFVNLNGSTNYGIGDAGCAVVNKVGKKMAGRLLDDCIWNEAPGGSA